MDGQVVLIRCIIFICGGVNVFLAKSPMEKTVGSRERGRSELSIARSIGSKSFQKQILQLSWRLITAICLLAFSNESECLWIYPYALFLALLFKGPACNEEGFSEGVRHGRDSSLAPVGVPSLPVLRTARRMAMRRAWSV